MKNIKKEKNKMSIFKKEIRYKTFSDKHPIKKDGNCYDIPMAETSISFDRYSLIPLGFFTDLPEHYRGVLMPRSSTAKRYGLNTINGEIEWNYGGAWMASVQNMYAKKHLGKNDSEKVIKEGSHLFQFYIEPLWDAPWYVHLKHFFTKYIPVQVSSLDELDSKRGGLGSTGK